MSEAYDYIGKPLGRAEGPEKVTGAAQYPADIKLPGMLVGACLRSPLPHARIKSIDVQAAHNVPGVHAVIIANENGGHGAESLSGWMPGRRPYATRENMVGTTGFEPATPSPPD